MMIPLFWTSEWHYEAIFGKSWIIFTTVTIFLDLWGNNIISWFYTNSEMVLSIINWWDCYPVIVFLQECDLTKFHELPIILASFKCNKLLVGPNILGFNPFIIYRCHMFFKPWINFYDHKSSSINRGNNMLYFTKSLNSWLSRHYTICE